MAGMRGRLLSLRSVIRPVALALSALGIVGLTACGGEETVEGERISLAQEVPELEPDQDARAEAVRLDEPRPVDSWPMAGGESDQNVGHIAFDGPARHRWWTSIGTGRWYLRNRSVLTQVIATPERLFTMDVEGLVRAYDRRTGEPLWSTSVQPYPDYNFNYEGGLYVREDRLFATTSYGELVALSAETGALQWRREAAAPLRAPPTGQDGRIISVTIDNRTEAWSIDQQETIWNHSGLAETSSILGAGGPAIDRNTAYVTYSSGEVIALRADTGQVLWSDTLSQRRVSDPLASVPDINAAPVVDGESVFAVAQGGPLVAYDRRSGQRRWEVPAGSLYPPVVSGNTLFLLSRRSQILAIDRDSGGIRWVADLPRQERINEDEGDEPSNRRSILWHGLTLADGRLFAGGSHGVIIAADAQSGDWQPWFDINRPISRPPVIVGDSLYVVTQHGTLHALGRLPAPPEQTAASGE